MSKLKTRKSVANRFKKTGSGKVKRKKSGQSHLKAKQKSKKTQSQRKLEDASNHCKKAVQKMNPYS
ncbi:MAG: 50S ribosomal protein L35 [Candidatus Paceibacteria bacterium]